LLNPVHGSPKTLSVADIEHEAFPRHEFLTTSKDVADLQYLLVY